jgi:hypothetical protein
MKLSEYLIGVGKSVAYYPKLRRITGSTNATIFLCQLIYWIGKEDEKSDGWVYKTAEEIEEETGLSYDEQKTARKKLIENGIIQEKYKRLEHLIYFKVDLDKLNAAWETPVPEHRNPTMGKAVSPHSLNRTAENTPENTTPCVDLDPLSIYTQQEKEVIKEILKYWQLSVPGISENHRFWRKGIHDLLKVCKELDYVDVLRRVHFNWQNGGSRLTIASPASLVKLANFAVSQLRIEQQQDNYDD